MEQRFIQREPYDENFLEISNAEPDEISNLIKCMNFNEIANHIHSHGPKCKTPILNEIL
jgi:hypothetical protein